jgi:hypothetical protein
MTSIVDLDRSHPGGIIGLAAGRSSRRNGHLGEKGLPP